MLDPIYKVKYRDSSGHHLVWFYNLKTARDYARDLTAWNSTRFLFKKGKLICKYNNNALYNNYE